MGVLGNQVARVVRQRVAQQSAADRPVTVPARLPVQTLQFEPDFLRKLIERQDAKPEVSRVTDTAEEGYVHLSSLIAFCARQYAISEEMGQTHLQSVTGGHRVTWALGRAAEQHVRSSFIAATDRRYLYGRWVCDCNQVQREGFYQESGVTCRACGQQARNYKEAALYDHDAKIVGNCDMPILVGRHMLAAEVKSMNKEEFEKLDAPKPDHVFQATGYRRLLIKNNHPVRKHVSIFYVQKEFKWGSPYKEFHVDATDTMLEANLDRAWAAARSLVDARDRGDLPARVCQNTANTLAKKCPVVGPCFNRRG